MRKKDRNSPPTYKIIVVDDEIGVIDSLSVIFKRSGYHITGTTDPIDAVDKIRNEHFDMLILDYLMTPIHGDRLVKLIREFNQDLYILLLTGYKDLAPPLTIIKTLDIQGYCEKNDRFDQLMLMVESGIKSVSQMRTIRKFKDGLNRILQSAPSIYKLQPINLISEAILTELEMVFEISNAFLLVDGLSTNRSCFYYGKGRYQHETSNTVERLSDDMLAHISVARTTCRNVVFDGGLIIPLVNEIRNTIGVIYVETEDISGNRELIEIFSNQALSALNNAFLHEMIQIKNSELDQTYELLKQRYMEIIDVLRVVVDMKDVYTRGHSDRVSYYAAKLGKELGLGTGDLETLRIGSLFHDIGKLCMTDSILLKAGKLTKEEYTEIKKHSEKGAYVLSAVSIFSDILPIVKYHHERVDGTGYPEGLYGNEIPLLAKITSVADAFDAMMSDRTYRHKMTIHESIRQLKAGMGTQFDTDITQAFVEIVKNYDAVTAEMKEKIATRLTICPH